jgi:hypothetical protein
MLLISGSKIFPTTWRFLALAVTTRNEAEQQSDGNSKSQFPSSKKLPIFNHQSRHVPPRYGAIGLDLCDFTGVWVLGFEIFRRLAFAGNVPK